MLSTTILGKTYEPFTFEVEKGRIGFFARAIGETDPVYFDQAAAKEAGYRNIPAPLTFPFTIAMEANQPFLVLEDLGVDKTRSMHGEQGFTYHRDICAGDTISGQQRVVEMFEKKGGALQFIVTETQLKNQHQQPVCDLKTVIIVRNG